MLLPKRFGAELRSGLDDTETGVDQATFLSSRGHSFVAANSKARTDRRLAI